MLIDPTLADLRADKLAGATNLKLACGLTEFPKEIYTLADTLEILDLSNNALSTLPDDLTTLHKLRILFCSSNQFTYLPEVLGRCPQLSMIGFKANQISVAADSALPSNTLRWLILTDNAVSVLPDSIGNCSHLQKLMLAGNQLSKLPESLVNCQNLELLRISANQLTELPTWLFNLPKLGWLAYAGNPFCDHIEARLLAKSSIRQIDWHSLTLQHTLGEGASGLIYHAVFNHHPETGTGQPLAVKMFKAHLTSDGLPRCEINATKLAGQHPNLFGLAGVIHQHPEDAIGLVMPLMPPHLKVLADPPSYASCTRDVYESDVTFSLDCLLNIASGIASAVAHLHARGMIHGDLYGHNILSDAHGEAILSDFGAASFLPSDQFSLAHDLQRIETRAFACLLEELLTRCKHKPLTQTALSALWHLQTDCAQPEIEKRPLFNEISQRIDCIQAEVCSELSNNETATFSPQS